MKTAVITGGSGSIGEALVNEFAKDFRVVFTYLSNEKKARETAEKYGAEAVPCDLTLKSDVNRLLKCVSSCDLLINNAGISSLGLFTDLSDDELYSIIDTDMISAMKLTKAVLPLMIRGVYGGSCEVAYSSAKAGLIGFTKALSKELGCSGIRVNCIAPGFIKSNMNSSLTEEEVTAFAEGTSLGKIGNPSDVALAARYLYEAEFVTGQVLGVDGGF